MVAIQTDLLDDAPALDPTTPSEIGIFDPLAAGENLAKESMVLELHVRAPGWSRSIDVEDIMDKRFSTVGVPEVPPGAPVDVAVAAAEGVKTINPKRLRAAKDIIDKREIRELHKFIGKTVSKIKNQRCLASNLLAPGMYILPLKLVNDVDSTIAELEVGIKDHLDKIEPRYNAIIEQAKKDLGPQFRQSDYLTFEQMRAAYRVEKRYLSFNVLAALAGINKALFDQALEQSKTERAEMAQVIRDGMRGGFLNIVSHFSEVLGKDDEGKPRVFHASTAEKLKDFCRTFTDRDLTGDTDLASLATQSLALVEGVDPKSIRSDEAFRETLANQFKQIVEKASAMVQTRERKLALDAEI